MPAPARELELTLENAGGYSATFSELGARLVELRVPDREGRPANVVLGFDDDEAYLRHVDLYFGATIGRVAGRIAGAGFSLSGERHELAPNEGRNHLHGGAHCGFDRVRWAGERTDAGIAFTYLSPAGEEGYPGTLRVRAEYSLSEAGELRTVYTAVADEATPVNLTNHAYWNLAGSGSVLDHELAVAASRTVAMDEELIPTGALVAVDGTALDFRAPRPIGRRLPEDGVEPWPGFDAAFVLDDRPEGEPAVRLRDPGSGRTLEIVTSEPSIQFYTANRVPEINGRGGVPYGPGCAVCLEPQRMPDAVNRPEFPSIVVEPGEEYRHVTSYRFSAR